MNPNNYRIETQTVGNHLDLETVFCWRGVSLSLRDLWYHQDWLSWELNLAQNDRYPDAPFPLATRNFQWVGGAEPVRWNHAHICFLQAHARKIQKWWRTRPTEVAVPSAEAVQQQEDGDGTELARGGCDLAVAVPPTLLKGSKCVGILTDTSGSSSSDDEDY